MNLPNMLPKASAAGGGKEGGGEEADEPHSWAQTTRRTTPPLAVVHRPAVATDEGPGHGDIRQPSNAINKQGRAILGANMIVNISCNYLCCACVVACVNGHMQILL